ncbi:hypothetical protein HHK36_031149 [Tetracentron sinense]|uniref:RRM domain-containing protein n=1 Tax=Tetracentron sinense TaxID=13715 RepID=A0A834YAR6_TETSI|nr:hypothetical protein HHK36_031149 [Tetracentron sinense]
MLWGNPALFLKMIFSPALTVKLLGTNANDPSSPPSKISIAMALLASIALVAVATTATPTSLSEALTPTIGAIEVRTLEAAQILVFAPAFRPVKEGMRTAGEVALAIMADSPRKRNETGNPGNTLYVTGLSTRVTERDLEDHFSKEGKVNSCYLVVEPRTRISRGFAFVTMDTLEDAERCIKHLNQSVLEGRYITVEKVIICTFGPMLMSKGFSISNPFLLTWRFLSRRKRPRTPTPGNYLGLKSTRESGYRGDRGRYRGGYGRDDYGYRRSPRRSPYRGGRDYSPRRSPYGGGRSRRDRSRSLPYSPYDSPERSYGRRSNAYAR